LPPQAIYTKDQAWGVKKQMKGGSGSMQQLQMLQTHLTSRYSLKNLKDGKTTSPSS
jgi:hypothetical protein